MKPNCKEDDENCEKCSNDEGEGLKPCPVVPGHHHVIPKPPIDCKDCEPIPPPPPEIPCDIAKIKEENE